MNRETIKESWSLSDLEPLIENGQKIVGNLDVRFDDFCSIHDLQSRSATWVKSSLPGYQALLEASLSSLIICDDAVEIPEGQMEDRAFIIVSDPKLFFAQLLSFLHAQQIPQGIHPTAIISSKATIGKNAYIGAFAIVGEAVIGDDCSIGDHSIIRDRVRLGNRVKIHENVLIGSDGFGFIRTPNGSLVKFPHVGKVHIEDDVEIYPFCNVDRATLGTTRIGKNTKIDHYSHIGHNCTVGEATLITAGIVTCGGAKVGSHCWLGVNTIVKEKIEVGDGATVGMGSVVTKNIPSGEEVWLGSPAEPITEFATRRKILKRILTNEQQA